MARSWTPLSCRNLRIGSPTSMSAICLPATSSQTTAPQTFWRALVHIALPSSQSHTCFISACAHLALCQQATQGFNEKLAAPVLTSVQSLPGDMCEADVVSEHGFVYSQASQVRATARSTSPSSTRWSRTPGCSSSTCWRTTPRRCATASTAQTQWWTPGGRSRPCTT